MKTTHLQALADEAPGADGHRQILRLAVNAAARARNMAAPWPITLPRDAADRATKILNDAGDLATWGAVELGTLREELLAGADRSAAGAWYTPAEIAHPLTQAALSEITDLALDDDPRDVLAVTVLDPACGGGVFLVAAARVLATAYAGLLYGTQEPAPLTVRTVMADVMACCVHGIDTDPVAVDVARSACWLETSGMVPITWLDRNIIVGDALTGTRPPALTDRTGPLAVVGNPPYRAQAAGAAPWLEARRPRPGQERAADELWRPSMDEFRTPGQGRREYVLANLYLYFWRWAVWAAFEARMGPAAIAYVTPNAWLKGSAFEGMRAALRAAADRGFIVDLTPEGKAPPGRTRIFPCVTLPVCAAVFSRRAGPAPQTAATVRYADVHGTRDEKFHQFRQLLTPRQAPTHPSPRSTP
ncbi:N-6 DNA methylase [Streptomyces sp. NBC_00670]|uniref:N-6 DNA methylase n=1 Tax=Streptomyces sp. NBC_00670 TaxID=2975804 RepID=UPI002E357A99|nr:N-6 DNA methylase [Streptomyces sp. NBC_00670]